MKYVSTTGAHTTDLRGALTQCFAPDGSLYMPDHIPVIPKALFNNLEVMNIREMAYVVVATLLGGDIDRAQLKDVVDKTFIYDIPFVDVGDRTEIMELFQGPTMAFKDYSAQFVANIIKSGTASDIPHVSIVATTGNTGAAIANAYDRLHDRHVVILYPQGALNRRQLAQFTTLGPNIHPIEVFGDIGRCKEMVRQAMADETLRPHVSLGCVNTSNYLRLVPQVVLFFYAYSHLKRKFGSAEAARFSPAIPCGNLSMLASAVIAKRMGLPMGKIIAGCSANDDLVRVLSGELAVEKVNHSSRSTLAKAMDSGYPTNLRRVLSLYCNDVRKAAADIVAVAASDADIADVIVRYDAAGYLADPHTAVALGAAEKCNIGDARKIVFATAHPAKSLDTMTALTGRAFDLPLQLTRFMTPGKTPLKMPPTYAALRKYLLNV